MDKDVLLEYVKKLPECLLRDMLPGSTYTNRDLRGRIVKFWSLLKDVKVMIAPDGSLILISDFQFDDYHDLRKKLYSVEVKFDEPIYDTVRNLSDGHHKVLYRNFPKDMGIVSPLVSPPSYDENAFMQEIIVDFRTTLIEVISTYLVNHKHPWYDISANWVHGPIESYLIIFKPVSDKDIREIIKQIILNVTMEIEKPELIMSYPSYVKIDGTIVADIDESFINMMEESLQKEVLNKNGLPKKGMHMLEFTKRAKIIISTEMNEHPPVKCANFANCGKWMKVKRPVTDDNKTRGKKTCSDRCRKAISRKQKSEVQAF